MFFIIIIIVIIDLNYAQEKYSFFARACLLACILISICALNICCNKWEKK
jgi:hypothetical protein